MILYKKVLDRIKKGYGLSYVHQFLILFNALFLIFIFNYFDEDLAYGKYILLISSIGFISNFSGFNSGEGVVFFLSKNHDFSKVIKVGVITDVIVGIAMLLIVILASPYLSSNYLYLEAHVIIIFALKTLFKTLRNNITGYWIYKKQFNKLYWIQIIELLLTLLLISMALISEEKFSLKSIIIIESANSFLFMIIAYIIFIFDYKRERKSFSNDSPRESLKISTFVIYNSKLFISQALKAGNKKIDVLLLGYFLTPMEVGIYDKIKKPFVVINSLVNPLRQLNYPYLLNLINEDKTKEVRDFLKKSSYRLSVFISPYLVLLIVFKKNIFELLNVIPSPSINILFFTLLITSFYQTLFWWVRIFSNSINPILSVKANLISTIILVSFSSILLRYYEFDGLSIALYVNFISLALFWWINLKKYVYNKVLL